jgi:AraC-like DNA-binding protein
MKNQSVTNNLDWISIVIYIVLVIMGWLNIYSSSLSSIEQETSIFDFSQIYGKQFLFILFSVPLIFVVLSVDAKFYEKYSIIIFAIAILSLLGLFVFGKTISGQRCWYAIGSFTLQPSEFAKVATSLALAKYLSDVQVSLKEVNRQIQVMLIVFLPVMLILPQPDPGSHGLGDLAEQARHYEVVARAITWLRARTHEQPSLEDVAAAVHLSPSHLQRVFSRWVGLSPKRFLQFLTHEQAKARLRGSSPDAHTLAVAADVGLSGPGRLHALMVT